MTRAPLTLDRSTAAELTQLFCLLAAIPSPTGSEAACGAAVTAELETVGLTVERDGAAAAVGGDCDNLYCRIPATVPGEPLFLCAHLDTVPPTSHLEPIVVDGVIRNATPSIVGADNKAAVAVVLHLARTLITEELPQPGIELLFTVGEEQGLLGSSFFDTSRLRAHIGFVFDHPGAIGGYVAAAPSRFIVTSTMHGRASHIGISPERGINAIESLAQAMTIFPEGTPTVSINVARIEGGTALNVIPDMARLAIDVRSTDHAQGLAAVERIQVALETVSAATGCRVETEIANPYIAYQLGTDSKARELAETACAQLGLPFEPIHTRGGSDANAFRVAGLDCINLAHAVVDFHGPEERVAISNLVLMERVTLEMISAACAG